MLPSTQVGTNVGAHNAGEKFYLVSCSCTTYLTVDAEGELTGGTLAHVGLPVYDGWTLAHSSGNGEM